MLQTPLHRLLGEAPGALTGAMIDAAVDQGIAESRELDWKTQLPPQREFKQSDHVKDIAAFANAGGGMLVFGVAEEEKLAVGRVDAGDFNENYERTIQQVCMTTISPPLFGVRAYQVGTEPTRAVALVVPASIDGPHLIFKGDQFAAPLRVDADTHWMKERELERAYRLRFDAARRAQEELQNLYDDMAQSFDTSQSAVFVGSARPRVPSLLPERREMADAAVIMHNASKLADWWLATPSGYHPLENVDAFNSRAGLRGWVAPPSGPEWRRARAAVFDDGSVSLAWLAGGHRFGTRGVSLEPWEISVKALEGFVAALLALVHAAAEEQPSGDVEVQVGIEWSPAETDRQTKRLKFLREDHSMNVESATPLAVQFRPLAITVNPSVTAKDFAATVVDLANNCVNQVGFRNTLWLSTNLPPRERRFQ